MGTAVVMVGLAANLDDVARNQLRFFAYELAVNSVEHGRFSSRPEIRLDVAVGDRIMELVYRDNAEPFVTDEHTALDLADKIANSEKRGFGLYILNQMGKSFNYERKDGWNTTTLTARLDKQSTQSSDRRSDMDGITVEVVPCNLRVTAILKPAGSIDSSTAQVVETHLNSAIQQGNTRVVIDFTEVDFVSSAGVGIFLGTVSKLRSAGGDLFFMRVPQQIQEVFDIINLKSHFRTIENIEQLETVEKS
jgi:anti-anti-sigma factor